MYSIFNHYQSICAWWNRGACHYPIDFIGFYGGHLNELLRRHASDDEAVQASCNWVDEWLEWCCNQEIWDRSQRVWDSNFSGPVPPLSFLPNGVVESSRERIAARKDESD